MTNIEDSIEYSNDNSSRKMWRKMTCIAMRPEGIPCECNVQTNEKGHL